MEQLQMLNLAQKLKLSILENQLPEARTLVEKLSGDVRKKLTKSRAELDSKPALFTAIKKGSVDFINFLVSDCHADLEERGIYKLGENRSAHVVTPLWYAAVMDQLEAVEALVSLGADVNAVSDSGSTPVRSSCHELNIEVVKFLADHGGDLEKPNCHGDTCLMSSVQSVELCRFLIDKGVDVNVVDTSGNLALHHAIRKGCLETVQLMVERGLNPLTRNKDGDDALQCASLTGYEPLVEFLFKTLDPSIDRRIESYQLMGVNFIDKQLDMFGGLEMWKKAIELRSTNCGSDVVGAKFLPLNPLYGFATEATTLPELDAIGHNYDLISIHALLLREKILGPNHYETILGLLCCGNGYADSHEFSRSIALFKYAFKQQQHAVGEYLSNLYIHNLLHLCEVFWNIHDNKFSVSPQKGLNFAEVFEVLDLAAQKCEEMAGGLSYNFNKDGLLNLMILTLHLVHLLYKLSKDDTETFRLKKLVYHLIRLGLRTFSGKSFLLLEVNKSSAYISDKILSPLPSVPVVDLLLECGADVQDVDENRNTVLHLLEEDVSNTDVIRSVARLLIAAGAHVDSRNDSGQRSTQHLTCDIDLVAHTTLKCLAARVIQAEKIPYVGIIPQTLFTFVEMH